MPKLCIALFLQVLKIVVNVVNVCDPLWFVCMRVCTCVKSSLYAQRGHSFQICSVVLVHLYMVMQAKAFNKRKKLPVSSARNHYQCQTCHTLFLFTLLPLCLSLFSFFTFYPH